MNETAGVFSFDACRTYVRSEASREGTEHRRGLRPSITVSRQAGSGGDSVCKKLAEHLNALREYRGMQWTVFDRDLVKQVLADHELPQRVAQFMPEAKVNHVRHVLEECLGVHPAEGTLFGYTVETAIRLAGNGHTILVGRGANLITRPLRNCFHLRITAPESDRIEHAASTRDLSRAAARNYVRKTDRDRRDFVTEHFGQNIEDPANYHMIVNSSFFSEDELVRVIAEALSTWAKDQVAVPRESVR